MKTRDGKDFYPGMILYAPFRRTDGDWYVAVYKQTDHRADFWEDYCRNCYATYDSAVKHLVGRIKDEVLQQSEAKYRQIGQWLDSVNTGRRINCVEN